MRPKRTSGTRSAILLARAPGRVNLIGEHVDYNGGYVLPVAIDLDVKVAASPRDDHRIVVHSVELDERATFSLRSLGAGPVSPRAGWISYVQGVAALLLEEGIAVLGADLAITSDVPRGVGLSSSAALEVACARALLALSGEDLPPERVALLCRRAEVEWAGVSCGIMDQFVAVLGRAGHALFIDCRSLAYSHVPIPPSVRIIATDSGVRRGLKDSEFNARVEECRAAAALLGVAQLRDLDAAEFAARAAALPEPLRRRARHVVHEIERTRDAADALRMGDLESVGRLMAESHTSLCDDFEVSTPELDALVDAACDVEGVYGSRLSGAGFGGATVSLVDDAAVERFARDVPATYHALTGLHATVYVCKPAEGASVRCRE